MSRLQRLIWLTLIVSLPSTAQAHLVSTRFGEYYSGLLHPLTTLVHLVPWLALAIFASRHSKLFARHILLVFPLAVGLGVLMGGLWGDRLGFGPWVLMLNIISFVALGGLVALARPLTTPISLALVVFFGLVHGFANGDVDLADGSLVLYVAGVISAAYLVFALVAASAVVIAQRGVWGGIALRALGSWILAAGLIYGGFEALGIQSV